MNLEAAISLPILNPQVARDYLSVSLAGKETIAPLPRVCAQLAELTAQQATDAAQLAKLIQSDPVLAGELMRVANSPALRPRSAIVSLQQAVSWLGVAEVRNIAMAVMLRGEVFTAPGHEPESEELWREAWLAGLWAKEIARERRKHVESAFLAALMHRTGAALALKVLSRFEREQRTVMDAHTFGELVVEFEPAFGRLLMGNWSLPMDVQDAASDWRNYRDSSHSDLAGTVHAAHLFATHTMHPQLLDEEVVIESLVFEQLGMFPDDRRKMLAKRDQVRTLAGL
ncbi:MAG TPA: HDOD domain-containing protein [Steroidobacteraceae bacterium]|nr:HDOD domain-containing protein [Steroidobacteraceae bacterium]